MVGRTKRWAKTAENKDGTFTVHLLPYHNLDVAACLDVFLKAEDLLRSKLASKLGVSEDEVVRILTFLYALHDAGKFATHFQIASKEARAFLNQSILSKPSTPVIRHDTALHWLFKMSLQKDLQTNNIVTSDSSYRLKQLFVSVAGHHGYPTPVHKWDRVRQRYGNNKARTKIHVKEQFKETYTEVLQFAEDLSELFGPIHLDLGSISESDFTTLTWLVAGVGTLSDWLGSSKEHFPPISEDMPLATYWESYALPQAQKSVEDSGVLSRPICSAPTRYSGLLPEGASLRPLQEWADQLDIEKGPKLIIIEDAPGSGKTEVALALARYFLQLGDATGIYFALPTQASSNAMFSRVHNFCASLFEPENPGTLALAHGASKLSAEFRGLQFGRSQNNAESTQWLSDGRKRTLLAQIGVGTVDQALISVLPKYFSNLRMAGLSRNVLIVDEVHAYEAYQAGLLEELLYYQAKLGMPVILLSATLPQDMREELVEAYARGMGASVSTDRQASYPLATYLKPDGSLVENVPSPHRERSYILSAIEDQEYGRHPRDRKFSAAEGQALSYIEDAVHHGRSVVWFRNTVKDALMAYKHLRDRLGPDRVLLAHAKFSRKRRSQIDQQALDSFGKHPNLSREAQRDKREGKVVICTQVFQESLDIDFDEAISDLAPIDVLLQRFGRVRRHKRRMDGSLCAEDEADERGEPVPVTVLMPEYSQEPDSSWYDKMSFLSSKWVYQDALKMWNTARLVLEHPIWELPTNVRYLMESVYGEDAVEVEGLSDYALDAFGERMADRALARNNRLDTDDGYFGNHGTWTSDEFAAGIPTRLGAPSRVWNLAYYDEKLGKVVPFESGPMAWANSEISVLQDKLKAISYPAEVANSLESQKEEEGRYRLVKWSNYLVMEEGSDGVWRASGMSENGTPVEVTYHHLRGLEIEK